MTIHNRIQGIFRLTRPLHCASPDKSLMKGDNDNETPTVQMRIVTKSGAQNIPYFPGNDLRGRLRRKAAVLVLDTICAGKKVNLELYAGLNSGAISASPDKASLTVEEVLRARDNVYMGLFGGGARVLRSRYSVADLVPVIADTIEIGMVPAEAGEEGEHTFLPSNASDAGLKALKGFQLIQNSMFLHIDDVLRVVRPDELEKYVGDPDAVAQYQASILGASALRKSEKAQAKAGAIKKGEISTKKGVGNIANYQSIIPGTPMYFQLDFADDVSDAHVGLMLLALEALVREQALGGWVRAGLGKFDAHVTLTRHGESIKVFEDGKNADDAALSPAVAQFTSTASDAVARLTEEEMMSFFNDRGGVAAEAA